MRKVVEGNPSGFNVPHYTPGISKEELRGYLNQSYPVILEIGCNSGEDTQQFLDSLPNCVIHCFECDPRPIQQFRAKISSPRCMLYELAVSDHCGTATLNMSGGTTRGAHKQDWDLSSSLLPPQDHLKAHKWCTFERQCEVKTTTLDAWAERHLPSGGLIDFIWMDVQGAEHLVFAGAQETLKRTRYLYTEYYDQQMYSGQKPLKELLPMLPDFELVAVFYDYGVPNAFLRNTRLTS